MKTNKYRGKCLQTHDWVYGSLIQGKADDGTVLSFIVPNLPCAQESDNLWIAKMYPVDTKTVGQFTGITDIKGTPIYENDLVLAAEDLSGNLFQWDLSEVFYFCEDKDDPTGDVGFWLEVGYPSGYRYNQLSAYKLNYYRVVGNIYDDDHLFYQDFIDARGERMFYLGDWWADDSDDSDHKLQKYLKELKQNRRKTNDSK